jgi:hypothetical protein
LSPGPKGEDFSGTRAVTSRNPLIHKDATNSTKSPRFGAEGLHHGLSLRAWRCVEEPFATVNFYEKALFVKVDVATAVWLTQLLLCALRAMLLSALSGNSLW